MNNMDQEKLTSMLARSTNELLAGYSIAGRKLKRDLLA